MWVDGSRVYTTGTLQWRHTACRSSRVVSNSPQKKSGNLGSILERDSRSPERRDMVTGWQKRPMKLDDGARQLQWLQLAASKPEPPVRLLGLRPLRSGRYIARHDWPGSQWFAMFRGQFAL